MKKSVIQKKRLFKLSLILFFVILAFVTIDRLDVAVNFMSRKSYNLSKVQATDEVVSDSVVIPDKYNTGPVGELEDMPLENSKGNEEGSITFLWRSNNHDVNIATIKSDVVVVENKRFNNPVRFLNEGGINKKIIFRNCSFTSLSTGRMGLDDWEVIFENCSFNHVFGSNLTFNNCYFGGSVSDGLNPFQNVKVYNCFFSDLAKSSTEPVENKLHSDATQMYGYAGKYGGNDVVLDVENIHFYNCRMEVPNLLFTNSAGYVNAALMIQPEYADLHDVKFEKCIINGGGFSIYISAKNNRIVRDLTLDDIKVGCSAWYGELYKGSVAVPTSLFEERNIVYNTSKTDKLYVGSVWKEADGVHISVTNDTDKERTLVVELANGEKKEFKIKASYPGSTWWDSKNKYVEENRDKFSYEDFPFDIELVVENTSSVRCYDGETLIRTQKLSDEVLENIKVKGITLDRSSVTLNEGDTLKLVANVSPENATNKNLVWSTTNENIASVDQNGLVLAKKEGNVVVTVFTEDGNHSAVCSIKVNKKNINVSGIVLDRESANLEENELINIKAKVLPENATNKKLIWSTSNKEIAIVDQNGLVHAIKEGNAVVTVLTEDGNYSAICAIVVRRKNNAVVDSSFDKEKPIRDIVGTNSGNKNLNIPKTEVTPNSENELINVTGVILDKEYLTVEEGDIVNLIATISPEDATSKKLIWTSSDQKIATVDQNGLVRAKKNGIVTITVMTEDGSYKATCRVTVDKKQEDNISKDELVESKDKIKNYWLPLVLVLLILIPILYIKTRKHEEII